jgi:tetratricopeptide (TPR) repeat protein
MPTDRYGLDLTTSDAGARDAYVAATDLVLTLYPGAAATYQRAIDADPGFALAHAGQARARQMAGDMAGARAALAAARDAAQAASAREQSHVGVIGTMIEEAPPAALAAVRAHVAQWPRDALIASTAANQTGLIATSGDPEREHQQLDYLAALAPSYGDDWWFNGHYGMALSELGFQDAARPRIERSMADNPRNATAAHALAHFHYENGEGDAADAFLRDWLGQYPRDGGLHGHLHWHLALVHLQRGDVAEGMRLYEEAFAAEEYRGPPVVKLFDAPSFLWRAELAGHPRDTARWRALRDFAERAFPKPGMPFADWHVALIDAVAGDEAAAAARAQALDALVREGRYAAGATVSHLARGFAAFARRDYAAAIAAIEPVFPERGRISGSRAQIDLVEFTLLASYLGAGRTADAQRLLAERRSGPGAIPVAGVAAQPVGAVPATAG